MKTILHQKEGFTLVEIMIVVAIIGMLAAIAIPNFVRGRKRAQTNACVNNLRQIDGAKHQWALETNHGGEALPNDTDITPYIGRGDQGTLYRVCCPLVNPSAPMAGYTINKVVTPPNCGNFDALQHPSILE